MPIWMAQFVASLHVRPRKWYTQSGIPKVVYPKWCTHKYSARGPVISTDRHKNQEVMFSQSKRKNLAVTLIQGRRNIPDTQCISIRVCRPTTTFGTPLWVHHLWYTTLGTPLPVHHFRYTTSCTPLLAFHFWVVGGGVGSVVGCGVGGLVVVGVVVCGVCLGVVWV